MFIMMKRININIYYRCDFIFKGYLLNTSISVLNNYAVKF